MSSGKHSSYTEVAEADDFSGSFCLWPQKDITELDITVEDSATVNVSNSQRELREPLKNLILVNVLHSFLRGANTFL